MFERYSIDESLPADDSAGSAYKRENRFAGDGHFGVRAQRDRANDESNLGSSLGPPPAPNGENHGSAQLPKISNPWFGENGAITELGFNFTTHRPLFELPRSHRALGSKSGGKSFVGPPIRIVKGRLKRGANRGPEALRLTMLTA